LRSIFSASSFRSSTLGARESAFAKYDGDSMRTYIQMLWCASSSRGWAQNLLRRCRLACRQCRLSRPQELRNCGIETPWPLLERSLCGMALTVGQRSLPRHISPCRQSVGTEVGVIYIYLSYPIHVSLVAMLHSTLHSMQLTCRLASLSSLVLSIVISHVSADSLFDARSPLPNPSERVLEYNPATSPHTECSKVIPPDFCSFPSS
jgi:hypothetical protein